MMPIAKLLATISLCLYLIDFWQIQQLGIYDFENITFIMGAPLLTTFSYYNYQTEPKKRNFVWFYFLLFSLMANFRQAYIGSHLPSTIKPPWFAHMLPAINIAITTIAVATFFFFMFRHIVLSSKND